MLVETAFISNREDERKLSLPAHRAKLANAIFAGIEQYFQGNAPDGTRLAAARAQRRRARSSNCGSCQKRCLTPFARKRRLTPI